MRQESGPLKSEGVLRTGKQEDQEDVFGSRIADSFSMVERL